MTRINTNVSSLVAQNTLSRSNTDLQTALTRLSTGLRINEGRDDPAGLIASETLRSDIGAVRAAITNTERANQVIATADSALGQVSSLLNDIRGLVTEAANTGGVSPEQIKANQTQIDSSLDALNRISQTTSFQGRRLLDGSLDFISAYTGGTGANVADLVINQASLGAAGSVSIDVTVTTAATQATISTTAGVTLTDDAVIQISGASGSEVFILESGATAANITDQVNLVSDATGVSATVNGGNVDFISTAYGSSAFVDIEIISEGTAGTLALDAIDRQFGTDVVATVNGTAANGDGNTLSVSTATLDV
ncbi:MAG: flagellin [Pirellulales bacterium]